MDGHEFVGKAIASGAVAVVAEDQAPADLKDGVAWVMVPDSREALGLLANRWNGSPSAAMRVVGDMPRGPKLPVTMPASCVAAMLSAHGCRHCPVT